MEENKKSGISKFAKILILLFIIGVIAFFAMVTAMVNVVSHFGTSSNGGIFDEKASHLTVLHIEGPIYDSEKILKLIKQISKDSYCRGLLLRVDSPGGAVGASQEIFAALKRLRKQGLPIVVSFGNVAASGGYYIALAGETIFSNPGTLTGSIGVIFQFPEAEKLLDKVGVSLQTIKSGALKDVGNPSRKPSQIELRYLQSVIDDTYDQFLNDVVESRKLKVEVVRPLADGRVMTGRQAKQSGLVDSLGGLDDAKQFLIQRTKSDQNISWTDVPKPKSRLEEFMDTESSASVKLSQWLSGVGKQMAPGAFFMWH